MTVAPLRLVRRAACGGLLVAGLLAATPAGAVGPLSWGRFEGLDGSDKISAENVILGVELGMLSANAILKSKGQPGLYCQPERLTLTMDQIETITRDFVDRHPNARDSHIAVVVANALADTFPCSPGAAAPPGEPPGDGPVTLNGPDR
jgi:hypothetical protein